MLRTDITRINPSDIISEKDITRKARLIQYLAQQCRVDVFDLLHDKGTGHWGGSSSSAELLATLYFYIMNIKPEQKDWSGRDRLVLSKGHGCSMLYSILAQRGYFGLEEIFSFRSINSKLQGHPCMHTTDGVEMSTGALGHGLSVALGMALAARLTGDNYRSFVILGEGCLDEGQSWEAMMGAAKFKPNNLVLMIDYNRVQLDGASEDIMPLEPLLDKLLAFNWNAASKIYDGHNVLEIIDSWQWIQKQSVGPIAVIYKTTKGKGVSFMENDHRWHGSRIDEASYANGRPELVSSLKQLEASI
jgi:transketolase